MKIKIGHSDLNGSVDIISSKSYIHRLLICAAFSDVPTTLSYNSCADDVGRTEDCLRSLGVGIKEIDKSTKQITPVDPKNIQCGDVTLNLGESGSTFRFMLPVLGALGVSAILCGAKRLFERPIKELADTLRQNGMKIEGVNPIKISGRLTVGDYKISGGVSSQFITGLLLALPLLDGESRIIIKGKSQSKDYINITLDVMKKFNASIFKNSDGYSVIGSHGYIKKPHASNDTSCISGYKNQAVFIADGDFSNAAFWLVGGAVSGDVTVLGINEKTTRQGDKAIIKILKEFGGEVIKVKGGIRVKKSALNAITVDAKNIPDLVPIISVAAANAKGKTVIKNVERLRDKECDRLDAILRMLGGLGIQTYYDGNLNIVGGEISGGLVDGCNDHRMVMSAAILALNAKDFVTVTDANAVNKSYPDFFDEFVKLGGIVKNV